MTLEKPRFVQSPTVHTYLYHWPIRTGPIGVFIMSQSRTAPSTHLSHPLWCLTTTHYTHDSQPTNQHTIIHSGINNTHFTRLSMHTTLLSLSLSLCTHITLFAHLFSCTFRQIYKTNITLLAYITSLHILIYP